MYRLSLPIYYTQTFKTKKDKTFLVSMNWERNAHFHIKNKVKQHYHELVRKALAHFVEEPIGKYRVKYKLFYKNKTSDLTNTVSMMDKYLNDALQDIGLVENDNVKYYQQCFINIGCQDKENPRVEIIIEGVEG